MMQRRATIAVLAWTVGAAACSGSAARGPGPSARTSVAVGNARPSLLVLERDGDGRGGVAVAVSTEGIAPDRGAVVAVALGALVEERLSSKGIGDVATVGSWSGWHLRALIGSSADAQSLVEATRRAMLLPVAPQDPALAAVARKVDALAHRPLPDRALGDAARCTGEAYGTGKETSPTAAELEAWRRAAHGLGRVAIATAGQAWLADSVASALVDGPAWPRAEPITPDPWPPPDSRTVVYDASGLVAPGGARVVLTGRTSAPERAVTAAAALGDARGPLVARLAALDAPARVRSVAATAHVDGGCVAVTIDLSAQHLPSDGVMRVATAAALARQELAVELADAPAPPELRRWLAAGASDPREAAERLAWWGLSGSRAAADDVRLSLVVGVAAARRPSEPLAGSREPGASLAEDTIRAEIDRATTAWQAPVVEARTRLERGQGEAWVLLASPCGTLDEANHDAGTGALVATALALQAAEHAEDAHVEPFIALDGVGILVHGGARAGESPRAHARRLADLAGRTLAADALDSEHVARARALLVARAGDVDARALLALASALTPGHPTWTDPFGAAFGSGTTSDEGVSLRAAAIRSGPLRAAVVANGEPGEAETAVRAIDRWVVRHPGDARLCPPAPTLTTPHPATIAVELPFWAQSEALLAVRLPVDDAASFAAATWLAALLDGPGGFLGHAVGGPVEGNSPDTASMRTWSASVLGGLHHPALVVRVVAPDPALDPAVAQVRALLDRLQKGELLREEDRARAEAAAAGSSIAAGLDPRTRLINLWRGDASAATISPPAPPLDTLRAFASAQLRDDALYVVAARPARERQEK
jgi:hypothetical protein